MAETVFGLSWPREIGRDPGAEGRAFQEPGSNRVLDFHGDPVRAGLCVFSDGNHHMGLEAAVRRFIADAPDVGDVFYTTTPPAPLLDAVGGRSLVVGNLVLSVRPHVFIGPGDVLDRLIAAGHMASHRAFMRSRGNVILVRKGNPKGVRGIADLLSGAVRLALSNPESEKASYSVYAQTLRGLAAEAGVAADAVVRVLAGALHSQIIHHREIPELLARGRADAAVVYYHLALRYCRIFPDVFDLVGLGGVPDGEPSAANVTTQYHIGLIGDGGPWGARFAEFMHGGAAAAIYAEHGLRRP